MGFIDKIGKLFGVDDDFDEDEEGLEEGQQQDISDYDSQMFVSKGGAKRDNKILNINATTQLEVVLVKPERFDDASGIADHLNNKRTVVLNLESTEKNVSRRLVDFLSGVAYANNSQIKRVANSTFIITPYNVGIVGDLLDELESSGVFF